MTWKSGSSKVNFLPKDFLRYLLQDNELVDVTVTQYKKVTEGKYTVSTSFPIFTVQPKQIQLKRLVEVAKMFSNGINLEHTLSREEERILEFLGYRKEEI